MKRLAILLLTAVMLFSVVSCGGDVTVTDGDQGASIGGIEEDNKEQPENADDKAEETKNEQVKNYPDNIMMDPYGSGGYVFFNRDVSNDSIETVTFLDTLADMPADAWDISKAKDGSVMAWVTDGVDLYIAGEGGVTAGTCNKLFSHYSNLVSVDFGGCFYTDLTDRLNEMFWNCESLETLDLSGWNTSNIKYMSSVFYGCHNLKSINMSGWDTSNVVCMDRMFGSCSSLESVDVSHFDMSNVVDYTEMFFYSKKLTSLDLSVWDTSAAKSMEDMFYGCKSLTTVGDLKIPEGCITEGMFSETPLA